jgi:RNA polymerase sigma-70 factor, ECF subfamily
VDAGGELVTLEHQDRSRWQAGQIAEGVAVLDTGLRSGVAGPYLVQAAIAACHATARRPEDTDWHRIAALYGELVRLMPWPVIELNRAVAVGMAEGPAAGLALVDALTGLDGYYLLPATRADLLRRLGRTGEAAAAYRAALDLATTEPERRYLANRVAEVTS